MVDAVAILAAKNNHTHLRSNMNKREPSAGGGEVVARADVVSRGRKPVSISSESPRESNQRSLVMELYDAVFRPKQ